MLRQTSRAILKRSRAFVTRIPCPSIPITSLENEREVVPLSIMLEDWRNTIIQLQDDADRLQWQVDMLNERLSASEARSKASPVSPRKISDLQGCY